ncbi:MAG: urease accessory protein UreE [Candidatus Symbiobacter sp.]|nr:urease accessory protein UreE [Candidatus Symbiobacter sp.]
MPINIATLIPNHEKLSAHDMATSLEIALPYEYRGKSRFSHPLPDGREAQFFLPRGHVLADGERLRSESGQIIRIRAAAQPVVTVYATKGENLTRAAYHLGNRHVPVQIGDGFLRFEPDAVLEDMIRQLGLSPRCELAPFTPESGAYGGGHRHSLATSFDQDYALAQKLYAEHEPGHANHHGQGRQGGHEHDD